MSTQGDDERKELRARSVAEMRGRDAQRAMPDHMYVNGFRGFPAAGDGSKEGRPHAVWRVPWRS